MTQIIEVEGEPPLPAFKETGDLAEYPRLITIWKRDIFGFNRFGVLPIPIPRHGDIILG